MKQLIACVIAASIALTSVQSLADKAGKGPQTLSNAKLRQLARADGSWVYLTGFELKRKRQHLLCAKKKRQSTPTCIVADTKGKILQHSVGFGLFKGYNAIGFRIGNKSSDPWLAMLLQDHDRNNSGVSNSGVSNYSDAFGHDLSGVKIHTGGNTNITADIGANAFSLGSDIIFGGQTGPGSTKVAHEVAHTIETSGGGGNPSGNTGEENSSGSNSSNGDEDSSGSGSGSNGSGSNGSGSNGSGSNDSK